MNKTWTLDPTTVRRPGGAIVLFDNNGIKWSIWHFDGNLRERFIYYNRDS